MAKEEKLVQAAPGVERLPEPLPAIIAGILNRLTNLEEGVAMPVKEQLPFVYDLAPLEGVMLTKYTPFSGYIKEVSPHWPDGCDHLVEIRVGHGTKQFCPNEGYLALNDVTPTYYFNEPVDGHEEVWVELRNTDGANRHAITVTVIEEGAAC